METLGHGATNLWITDTLIIGWHLPFLHSQMRENLADLNAMFGITREGKRLENVTVPNSCSFVPWNAAWSLDLLKILKRRQWCWRRSRRVWHAYSKTWTTAVPKQASHHSHSFKDEPSVTQSHICQHEEGSLEEPVIKSNLQHLQTPILTLTAIPVPGWPCLIDSWPWRRWKLHATPTERNLGKLG